MSAPGVCLLWRGCLLRGGGGVWSRGDVWSRGVPAPGGGGSAPRGVPGGDPPGTATAASGTHPTGMHSCLL